MNSTLQAKSTYSIWGRAKFFTWQARKSWLYFSHARRLRTIPLPSPGRSPGTPVCVCTAISAAHSAAVRQMRTPDEGKRKQHIFFLNTLNQTR